MVQGPLNILVLGAGWTSEFLIPLLKERDVSFAATSRDGGQRYGVDTIKFTFDPKSEDAAPFTALPDAQTILITFPIYISGASERLVRLWKASHPRIKSQFVQLGSTGIWNLIEVFFMLQGDPTATRVDGVLWLDRHSAFDRNNERGQCETELLALSPSTPTTVMNLSGLWGGTRSPKNWVARVASSKESLKTKGNIHLIHGFDVARAIVAVHQKFDKATGERWLLTDCRVYDWWDLASAWGSGGGHSEDGGPSGPQPAWVRELMEEKNIRALPRPLTSYSRVLDSRDFWKTFDLSPSRARLD